MDADAVNIFNQMVANAEYPTLLYFQERLKHAIDTEEAIQQFQWHTRGYKTNPDGLRCELCGAPTYGKQIGRIESIKCSDFLCNHTKNVAVG